MTSVMNFFSYSLALMSMTATFLVRTLSIALVGSYDYAISDDVIIVTFKYDTFFKFYGFILIVNQQGSNFRI